MLFRSDGILKAKSEMFGFLKPDAHIILNGADDKLAAIGTVRGVTPLFYAIDGENQSESVDISVSGIQNCGLKGMKAELHTPKGNQKVHIPIPGKHNIYNTMAAAGVGLFLDLNLNEIKAGIESVETIGGRSNLLDINDMVVIDDCYNANPVSMKASIDVLKNGLKRTIAVLGDMGELGEHERQLHYEVGQYIAEKQVDVLFCAGTLSEEMAKGARENGTSEVFYFKTRDEMLPELLKYLKAEDTVLVKSSHFMDYSKVVDAIREYAE